MRTFLLLLVALILDAFCVLWVLDGPAPVMSFPADAGAIAEVQLLERAAPYTDFETVLPTPAGALEAVPVEAAAGPIPKSCPVLVGVETWRSLASLAQTVAEVPPSDGDLAGRAEGVLELLDAAVTAAQGRSADERIYFANWIESNPSFEELRADRRFQSLLERLVGPVVGGGLI